MDAAIKRSAPVEAKHADVDDAPEAAKRLCVDGRQGVGSGRAADARYCDPRAGEAPTGFAR